jgi:hypothetical protein
VAFFNFPGIPVKQLNKLTRLTLIAAALVSMAVHAQDEDSGEPESMQPGLYATTDEGHLILIQDGEVLELAPGDSAFASEEGLKSIDTPPSFLNWPCSSDAAQSRKFATYAFGDLTDPNRMKQIAQRYFGIPEVIEPIPNWIDGDYHGKFSTREIIQFPTPEYWYFPNPERPFLDKKRPKILLINLFIYTSQVIIDNNALDALREYHGNDEIPVVFVFNDANAVPITYFGDNVSMKELFDAYFERGIKIADVPMWWLGDFHLAPTVENFELIFDIPALEDISAGRQAALTADLEKNGFENKPIIVSLLAESETMVIDQPERVRMAVESGYTHIPTVFSFTEPDAHLARCGPGTPAGFTAATAPSSGAPPPPPGEFLPPRPEPPASES